MGYVYGLIILAAFWVLKIVFGLIHMGLRSMVAGFVTPKNHRPIGNYEESEGYESLRKEGFDVTADWAGNAMSKVLRS